ncbi:hypothetical protein M5K25_022052 [Dendrobium thyrsiflorum]|uniref:Uncharacterized protein n=1 Tax=Dendrobium thyrsiflorum TaxID=117978 RepID=A0ABD0UBQ3_DENTH
MGSLRASTMFIAAFFLSVLMEIAHGQMTTKTSSRWIDGKAIDQGIAYFLMLVALVVTFLFINKPCFRNSKSWSSTMKAVAITTSLARNLTPIVKVATLFPHVVILGCNTMNNPACPLPSSRSKTACSFM